MLTLIYNYYRAMLKEQINRSSYKWVQSSNAMRVSNHVLSRRPRCHWAPSHASMLHGAKENSMERASALEVST